MEGWDVDSGVQEEKAHEIEHERRACIYNLQAAAGYSDLFDPSLHIPFNWEWKNTLKWSATPEGWKLLERSADTGKRVRIKCASNDQYMTAPDGISKDAWIYCRGDEKDALEFIMVGDNNKFYLRLPNANLFLSYEDVKGAVKLYDSPDEASYRLEEVKPDKAKEEGKPRVYAIKNNHENQYMWLSEESQSPYVSSDGKRSEDNAHWIFEHLYTVQPGENLSVIAARFRTTAQKLATWNDLEKPDEIDPGQVLKIP